MPSISRRSILVTLAAGAATFAQAADYPNRPVRLVVPVAPGGPADTSARLFAAALSRNLGQAVIVENKSGAAQTIGTRAVALDKPDGYTLLFSTSFPQHPLFANNGVAVGDVLIPVSNVVRTSLMLVVRKEAPVKSFAELVSYAKANPGKLNNAVSGASIELVSALFRERTGIAFADIPYQGESQAVVAMLGRTVDMSFMSPSITVPHLRDGKLRALMTLGAKRQPLAPDVPTAAEAGIKDFNYSVNLGLWAPKGTPVHVVERLNAASIAVAKDADFVAKAQAIGFEVVGSSPQEQLKTYEREIALFGEAARLAKFSPR